MVIVDPPIFAKSGQTVSLSALTGKIIGLNPARPGWGKFYLLLKIGFIGTIYFAQELKLIRPETFVTLSGVPPSSSRPDLIENQGAAGLGLGERVADDADADQDGAAHVDDAPQA